MKAEVWAIPYAHQYEVIEIDTGPAKTHVCFVDKCPECGAFIEQVELKDEESHTHAEFADHFQQKHGGSND